ncbi:MAG: hypothetical protein ACJ8LN_11595, partial [Sulfurifustis sp.]
ATIVQVAAGDAIDAEALTQLPLPARIQPLRDAKRRQSIGIYATPPANAQVQASREQAVAEVDLQPWDRLGDRLGTVPFALRVPYRGAEAAARALYGTTGFRVSLDFKPCDCGPIAIGNIRIGRVSVVVTGGGGQGAPNPDVPTDQAIATSTVATILSCSIAGADVAFAFDASVHEALEVPRVTGGPHRLAVKTTPNVGITRITSRDVPELASRLAEGNLGQKLLAALLRPAVFAVRGVQNVLGNALENLAPKDLEGLFSQLAEALATDIMLERKPPADPGDPLPPAQKLQFDLTRSLLKIGAEAVDMGGSIVPADRRPAALVIGRARSVGDRTVVSAGARIQDFRNPKFQWSTAVPGAQFVGGTTRSTVEVSYPSGSPLRLTFNVVDDDDLSITLDGEMQRTAPLVDILVLR